MHWLRESAGFAGTPSCLPQELQSKAPVPTLLLGTKQDKTGSGKLTTPSSRIRIVYLKKDKPNLSQLLHRKNAVKDSAS